MKTLPIDSYKGSVLSFGKDPEAKFRAANVKFENNRMLYTLQVENKDYNVPITGYGEHNVYNSLAAIASTSVLGIPIEDSIQSLSTFRTMELHN